MSYTYKPTYNRSDNASVTGSDHSTDEKEAVALKIAKHKATLDAIAKKDALVRKKILELESQAMADMESDDENADKLLGLEWPDTPPPRYLPF